MGSLQIMAADIPLNIDWLQILLHLLNFAILTFGLYLLLYKPVKKFMAKRREHYKKLSDEADDKLARAQTTEAVYQKRLEGAEAEIVQMKAQAAKEAEEIAEAQLSDARAQCERLLHDAVEGATAEREKILSSANEEIAKAAILATEKLMAGSYDTFLEAADKERK